MKHYVLVSLGMILGTLDGARNDKDHPMNVHQLLQQAKDTLEVQQDYPTAIAQFENVCHVYEGSCEVGAIFARLGLAMSYHHVGNNIQRDQALGHALGTIGVALGLSEPTYLQENMLSKEAAQTYPALAMAMASYLTVGAYRRYTDYEAVVRQAPVDYDNQVKVLQDCLEKFTRVIAIAQDWPAENSERGKFMRNGQHGSGTATEFLSKTYENKGDVQRAQNYQRDCVYFFMQAVRTSEKMSDNPLHTARSSHKLARNCLRLAHLDPEWAQIFRLMAQEHYERASSLYTAAHFDIHHPKRQEFEADYQQFKDLMASQQSS